MPYFSIIVPTFNRARRIEQLISSIKSQTYQDFEVVIVDDGSTDDTEETVKKESDPRIRYYKKKNEERSVARNFGMKHSAGEYVNYFDSDDVMYNERLSEVFRYLKENGEPEVVFTHYDLINDQQIKVGQTERFNWSFTENLWFNNFLAAGAVFVKRQVAKEFLFCEDPRLLTAEDWELWLRVHCRYQFHEIRTSTFAIVQHSERSIFNVPVGKVESRETFFAELVRSNQQYVSRFGKETVQLFQADRFTFIALSFAINGSKGKAFLYLIKSFLKSPFVLKRRRFWGVIKNLV